MLLEDIKNKIIQIINKNIECEAILIFGSYIRGSQREDSDIDIAIKSKENFNKKKIIDISNELEEQLKIDVDLVDLDLIENDGFKYEILISGELIYCEDRYNFDMYKLDAFREYLELNESRKYIINELKRRD